MQIVMPCAGAGKRFKEAGYGPKPLIDVDGLPMYLRSGAFFEGERFYLVNQESAYGITEGKPIPIEHMTEGAACTVLIAEPHLDPEKELLIINCDQIILYSKFNFDMLRNMPEVDGIVFTFTATDPKWSYVETQNSGDKCGRIIRAAEKQVISHQATCGAYYFKKAKYFFKAAKRMIEANDRTNGEFYVCPVLNHMDSHLNFFAFEVEKMIGLGTPEDLEKYLCLWVS